MKKWKKKMAVLVASLLLALGLCGCALETSAENLFTLPEVPVEYTGLSNTLNTYLKSGYEYINPTGGSNMQSLQMIDLDGDGRITVRDVLAALRILLDAGSDTAADLDGDGRVTMQDVVLIPGL